MHDKNACVWVHYLCAGGDGNVYYVTVDVGGQRKRTRVSGSDINSPQWTEDFILWVDMIIIY